MALNHSFDESTHDFNDLTITTDENNNSNEKFCSDLINLKTHEDNDETINLENLCIIAGISCNVKNDKRNPQSIDDIDQPPNPSFDNASIKFIFAINNTNFHDDNDEVTSLNKKLN